MASVKCPRCAADNDPQLRMCFSCGASLADLGPGSIVAERYEILQLIGKGGMGQIFKAFDRTLDEVIALKVLRPELTQSEEMVKRFRNEVRLARKISHTNVASLYEYGVYGELQFISMELLDGVTLRKTLRDRGQGLDWPEAFGAVISLAAGLKAIHDAGIIHRDLKTENIIIEEGVVRLVDFGIAKGMVQKAGAPLTRLGMILGTPQFMSPEQCQAKTVDARTDIYSLGIVCYEIFTATLPFDDESPMATMMLQIGEKPPFHLALEQGLPDSMVSVLRRALSKDPDGRFASAAEFRRATERARDQSRTAITDRVSVGESPDRRRVPTVGRGDRLQARRGGRGRSYYRPRDHPHRKHRRRWRPRAHRYQGSQARPADRLRRARWLVPRARRTVWLLDRARPVAARPSEVRRQSARASLRRAPHPRAPAESEHSGLRRAELHDDHATDREVYRPRQAIGPRVVTHRFHRKPSEDPFDLLRVVGLRCERMWPFLLH